ncbi:ATP-dependent helicase [Treponema sp.]|uniref:ATP-dependent helicase n=1 Tax=Treponema sp. TaxID=166 RepID=UPI0026010461|nr:UvrD-helicase domain-containing protein [Treponema sp.]MCR5218683.1 ATP-dependent helicase [Treponema sp.]
MEPDYLSVLNDQQKEAVVHEGSSLLILAGAGSGKTRVITTKIAYLISQKNINPFSILAVTFTKKAAAEMKERAQLLEERSRYCQIRTFHSWGAYFLRKYPVFAGVSPDFTVYDDDDMVTLLMKAVPSLKKKDASHYVKKISLAKDYCLLPDSEDLFTVDSDSRFPEIYKAYEDRLKQTGNVDFGDLILLPYLVMKDNPKIRHEIHQRYKVIMVDEYQDSNVAQFNLLKMLSGAEEDNPAYVCVVGDDDQSIYKFRGAEVRNILNFQKDFKGTDLIRLETNYRSTQEILDCADSIVRNNHERIGKTLVSHRGKGVQPALVFLPGQDDETEFCSELISQSVEKGGSYSDWAILYRTNAQSLGFETEFLHRKIPYEVVGSLKFYEREEIKDALSWISFIANPRDEIAFRRIINKPVRGIGPGTQDKILAAAAGNNILLAMDQMSLTKKARAGADSFKSVFDELSALIPQPEESLESNASLAQSALSVFDDEKEALEEEKKESEVSAADDGTIEAARLSVFVEAVIKKTGLEDFHAAQDEIGGTQKVLNLHELVNSAVLYECNRKGLLDFLDHISLDRTLETQEELSGQKEDRVTLITIHNTKGLEFPKVIITGMENEIFPRMPDNTEELEEERRLFYVGITRAKNELYFTSCSVRRLYGRTNAMSPSVFLKELDGEKIRVLGTKPQAFISNDGAGDPVAKKYCVGAQVYHDDWGYGQIVRAAYSDTEGDEEDNREWVVSVSFDTGGIKKFIPKYQASSLIVCSDE